MFIKNFLFGEDAPYTGFIAGVCNVFKRCGLDTETCEQDCRNFVKTVSEHKPVAGCVDALHAELIVDSLCGPGTYDYLVVCNNVVVDGFKVYGFTPEEVTIDKTFVEEAWGFYTGCKNVNVYATFYRWATRLLAINYGCANYVDMLNKFRQDNRSAGDAAILKELLENSKTADFEEDSLDRMFPIEQIDEQQLRLEFVTECVRGKSSNPYKDLVIKYLDMIEAQEMKERAR